MRLSTKLYSCIISPDISRDKAALIAVAEQFAHSIEVIEDGILFDVSGLERLIGKPDRVAQKVLAELQRRNIEGRIAVADTVDTAKLLARCTSPTVREGETAGLNVSPSFTRGLAQPDMFEQIPLADLDIERDTLNVFSELGIRKVSDLLAVPHDDLVSRYGKSFQDVIDVLEQKGRSLVTPNVKENRVYWNYDLDQPVENFEQLIFLLNHGLDKLFGEVAHCGFSTEHLDISIRMRSGQEESRPFMQSVRAAGGSHISKGVISNPATKTYEIKTSFPTLERAFWLKFINLRISLDPPDASINGVDVTAHFTKPRPSQRGLYAVSRPEPESLLLTVNKLKKLVGEDNVGVPILLNQRLAKPFKLDADAMPDVRTGSNVGKSVQTFSRLSRSICGEACFADNGKNDLAAMPPCPRCGGIAANTLSAATEKHSFSANRAAQPPNPVIALTYLRPPLRAEVLVRDRRLVFIRTPHFAAHVAACSGVWKGNSHWWDKSWKTQEWDIEVENNGVYRLCKVEKEWFLSGEYD